MLVEKINVMIIRERVKTVEVKEEVFITRDGKEFSDRNLAYHHECILDGTRKVCDRCNGKGNSGGRWVRRSRVQYMPRAEDMYDHYETETCSKCSGKGYLEIKWC